MQEKMELERQLAFLSKPEETDKDYEMLKSQVESLKLEKEELLRFTAGGTKGESYQLIKDLSNENAKLRMQLLVLKSK